MPSLDQILEDGVRGGAVPGAAAAYATRDGEQFLGAAGFRCLASGAPMSSQAIFRIASMTKAITSIAALRFVDDGLVGLDDEMVRYLPELRERPVLVHIDEAGEPTYRPSRGAITLRHLLTHTAGFGWG